MTNVKIVNKIIGTQVINKEKLVRAWNCVLRKHATSQWQLWYAYIQWQNLYKLT